MKLLSLPIVAVLCACSPSLPSSTLGPSTLESGTTDFSTPSSSSRLNDDDRHSFGPSSAMDSPEQPIAPPAGSKRATADSTEKRTTPVEFRIVMRVADNDKKKSNAKQKTAPKKKAPSKSKKAAPAKKKKTTPKKKAVTNPTNGTFVLKKQPGSNVLEPVAPNWYCHRMINKRLAGPDGKGQVIALCYRLYEKCLLSVKAFVKPHHISFPCEPTEKAWCALAAEKKGNSYVDAFQSCTISKALCKRHEQYILNEPTAVMLQGCRPITKREK